VPEHGVDVTSAAAVLAGAPGSKRDPIDSTRDAAGEGACAGGRAGAGALTPPRRQASCLSSSSPGSQGSADGDEHDGGAEEVGVK